MKVHLGFFTYGGIEGRVFDCVLREVIASEKAGIRFVYQRCSQDALISRSRSWIASVFFRDTDCDVLFMLDHDIEFERGDVLATCRKAVETQAVVAGMYACRGVREGHASFLEARDVRFEVGGEKLHEAEFVAGGFVAIPRSVIAKVLEHFSGAEANADLRVRLCKYEPVSIWDLFRPVSWPSPRVQDNGMPLYLSEDWAFSLRAREAGAKLYVWEKPRLVHHGSYGYCAEDGIG